MKTQKSFIREENAKILNQDLTIHWWNCRSKTLSFKGTAKEFLKKKHESKD